MITNRTIDDIVAHWQRELDTSLETGETPVLYVNAGAGVLDDLAGAVALQWWDEQRRDGITPLVAAGGAGPAWMLALLHTRAPATPLRSPGAVTAYSGPDAATHAAALSVLDTRRSHFRRRPADLPPAFQPSFVPHAQAGSMPLESLPFLVSEPAPGLQRDGWSAWVAVVLVVALFLIALVA
jgi:hypothetical protein